MNRRRGGYSSGAYDWDYAQRRYAPDRRSSSPLSQARHTASNVAGQVANQSSEMMDEAGERMGEAGERIQETGASMWATVRQNPLPAAMTAVGIAWLLGRREPATPRRYGTYSGSGHGLPGVGGEPLTSDYRGNDSQGALGEVGDQLRGVVDQAQEQVGAVRSNVYHRTRRTQSQLSTWVHENPLGVAAVALGVGTAVGLAVPSTPQESQLMGEARDSLMDRAREVAQDTTEKVQQVAEQAKQAATEEARQQHLTTT
jgi:ElaB/YqjD/DUF883 family membrane-anchored ribosome-binding protein